MKRTMIALAIGAVLLSGCSSTSDDSSKPEVRAQASQVAVSQAKAVATAKAAAVKAAAKAKAVATAKAAAVSKAKAKAIAKAKTVAAAKARAAERARLARAEARATARAEARAAKRSKARASVHDLTSCSRVYGGSSSKCNKYDRAPGEACPASDPACNEDETRYLDDQAREAPQYGAQCRDGDEKRYSVCAGHKSWVDGQVEFSNCLNTGGKWIISGQSCSRSRS